MADGAISEVSGASGIGGGSGASADALLARVRAAPFLSSLVACCLLALLSDVVLPTIPSYDPWSWIVWGREVFDPHLSLIIGGGSSWKPFPVIFTSIYGLFAGAPRMWVITERAGALMAFVAAYRLAHQMTVRLGYRRAAPVAGVIAAASLILLQDFAYYFYRGASEPILVGAALWAVDRLLAGKRWQAYALGVVLGLMRPEDWPLMVVFGAYLAWTDRRVKVWIGLAAGFAFMPFMWFVPPGATTGNWFSAASQAHSYDGHLGGHPLIEVLRRGVDDSSVPILVLALICIGITLYKERDRVILICAGLGLAWWVVVWLETAKGYPGLERFFLPGAAMACVLAGVGVVRIGALIGELAGHVTPGGAGGTPARAAAVLASVIAVVIAYVYVDGRVTYSKDQYSLTKTAVTRLQDLQATVNALGGHDKIFPCKNFKDSYIAINHSLQTALAWTVHSTLERTGTRMSYPGLYIVGPYDSIDGAPAELNSYFDPAQTPDGRKVPFKTVREFQVFKVYRAGQDQKCIGS